MAHPEHLPYVSLIGVLALAGLHVVGFRLHRGSAVKPTWLTVGSGVSIAYVFAHLLPELAESQQDWLAARPHRALGWLDTQVYLAALVGVIISLSLDRVTTKRASSGFWLHVGSFAIYNALIGAFALRVTTVVPALLAVLAFGAHFLVNDHGLYRRYSGDYVRVGRWVLAASIVAGWIVAVSVPPPEIVLVGALGLVSGGMIASAIREELPEQDRDRLAPWVAGAVGYTVLLLALTYSQQRA